MLLEDRVALVTGGGRGLGRAHALALAKAGAKIVVNDLGGSGAGEGADVGPAQSVVREILAAGGKAYADVRSVANWDTAQSIVADAVKAFGKLDILVNNAGIVRPGAFGDLTEADWNQTSAVNLMGPIAIMDAAVRLWRREGPKQERAIINVASPAGLHPVSPIGIYSATKAGLVAISQVAAQELVTLGVKVNSITPIARTRMIDGAPTELIEMMAPRDGFDPFLPEHVSQLVVYLASPLCRFTGSVLGVGGDDVFLYTEWSADHNANNRAVQWTPETLAEALKSFPTQDMRWILMPGGRMQARSPSDEILSAARQNGTVAP
jgi:NAD(P)-dependent dehydrogenase (short-subunit alcohol dehydrogenase family)